MLGNKSLYTDKALKRSVLEMQNDLEIALIRYTLECFVQWDALSLRQVIVVENECKCLILGQGEIITGVSSTKSVIKRIFP